MDTTVDLDALIAKARARKAETDKLKMVGQQLQAASASASEMPSTVGGEQSMATVAGRQFNVAPAQEVNWAAPLAKLGTAYFQKQTEDKVAAAEEAAVQEQSAAISAASGNDPETQRLVKLAQLGVPGADKALAAKMTPTKKQPIAGLLQALPNLTAEAAPALAAEYNIPVEQVQALITGAQKQRQQQSEEEYRRDAALKQLGIQPRAMNEVEWAKSQGMSLEDYLKLKGTNKEGKFDLAAEMDAAYRAGDMPRYNQLKDIAFASRGKEQSSGEVAYPLTPGQKGVQAKLLVELDKQMEGSDQFITDLSTAHNIVTDPKNFSTSQKAAWAAANSSKEGFMGDAERVAGASMLNPDLTVLNSIFMSKTLDDMAKLGGGDSNEELRTIRSSYPNAMQSQEAAQKLLERLRAWEEKTRGKITAKRQDIQSGRYFSQNPEDIRTESYTPKDPVAPSAVPAPQIKIRSIR